jgi:hypothetical protein
MPKNVQSVMAHLFLGEKPLGHARDFTWRLIRRRRRPFLLLPTAALNTFIGLELYSAQRRRAKIWRALLPVVLRSPGAAIFQKFTFRASENSDLIRFLSEQSGVPFAGLPAPAIKFGGTESQKSRLVLLVCDQTNRPLKVVKLGLDASGRAATDREAGLLEKLPANKLGCIHLTGRLRTPEISAFATDYYPGASPNDDAGMEVLFHSWLQPGPAQPIENFDAWRELETQAGSAAPDAWPPIRAALAGNRICSTLHHGDFAPWNIRAINSQDLQAFDWERGNLQGIPGWDWFHFVVQTSILARRHSVERVAAELEELLRSPRFEKFADAAGISSMVKPLVLAYLLHHRWVVQPLEGGQQVDALFALLAARWQFSPPLHGKSTGRPGVIRAPADPPGLWADAWGQLNSAWSQLANVFWEPTLSAGDSRSLSSYFKSGWPVLLLAPIWLAAVANVQYFYANHLTLLPLYALPCLLAAWKINRRWGTVFAYAGAVLGPMVAMAKDPASHPVDLLCWNSVMRLILLQLCVFLTDRIRQQEDLFRHLIAGDRRTADLAGNWAVVLASGLGFFLIAWGDLWTGPRVSFLPLYLIPAILLTLFMNLRWGAFAVLLGALVGAFEEYVSRYNTSVEKVFGWNFPMHFLMLFVVLLLLDRLRHESVLFPPAKAPWGLTHWGIG